MSPTPRQYLEVTLSKFPQRPVLTEKLRESLLRGLAIARKKDVYAYDDTLILGLLAAKSVVVPILDSAGVNIRAYSKQLRDDLLGYDIHSESPFREEYENLKSTSIDDPGAGTSLYLDFQLAKEIADQQGLPAIDFGLLFQVDVINRIQQRSENWR